MKRKSEILTPPSNRTKPSQQEITKYRKWFEEVEGQMIIKYPEIMSAAADGKELIEERPKIPANLLNPRMMQDSKLFPGPSLYTGLRADDEDNEGAEADGPPGPPLSPSATPLSTPPTYVEIYAFRMAEDMYKGTCREAAKRFHEASRHLPAVKHQLWALLGDSSTEQVKQDWAELKEVEVKC